MKPFDGVLFDREGEHQVMHLDVSGSIRCTMMMTSVEIIRLTRGEESSRAGIASIYSRRPQSM